MLRSYSYLKKTVLPALAHERWIEKVHTTREMAPEELAVRDSVLSGKTLRKAQGNNITHEWVWQRRIFEKPNPPRKKVVYGTEVGVEEDFSHLNRRRQRSREASIQRDVKWMHELDDARIQARRAAKAARAALAEQAQEQPTTDDAPQISPPA